MWLCVARVSLTLAVHSHLKAFLQSAVLTAVALLAGHLAVLVPVAAVDALVANTAFEEALTPLTGNDAIVQPGCPVPTDQTPALTAVLYRERKRDVI